MKRNKQVKKINVLQINIGEKFGGVSSMIYNIYQNIDQNLIQFDFVAPSTTSFEIFREEIEKSGGRIIELKSTGFFLKRKIQFFHRFYKLLKTNQYDVIHCNSGSVFFNLQVATIAKICKIKKIIVHSHNAGNDNRIKITAGNNIKWLLPYVTTDFFSCSMKASEFMFPEKILNDHKHLIIKNGVEIDRFKFNQNVREEIRSLFNLDKDLTILHVGRFTNQKNHEKLIEIFNEIQKINKSSKLLLVGEGELESTIKQKVIDLSLVEKVLFLGFRQDIPNLMSASDIFLLPSKYEGLPVVGIEAQTNGLKCFFSDAITDEINLFSNRNEFISLDEDSKYWAEKIMKMSLSNDYTDRTEYAIQVSDKGYSLESVGEIIQELYLK